MISPDSIDPSISQPLSLTLFGPMQVWVAGRPIPRLRSRKSLWLLALLVLRHGRPVEREWLAETLWPDADQDQGASRLRPILSELRKALGSESWRLHSPSHRALSLDTSDIDVDILQFDAAVSAGTLSDLEQATALYQGPLLEGCAEEWVFPERTSREMDCLQSLETLASAAMAAARWSVAADYFRRAIALDAWRDGTRRGLMEALARGGDINAALQAYREFVAALREDPKAVPDEQTTALYRRLRAEARRPAPVSPQVPEEAPREEATPVSGSLPHPLTDLVGREDEREDIADLLRRSRLLTLTGPGGIGKTRLAIAVANDVAHEYPDGVWMAALEALTHGERIATQIADVLGLKEKEKTQETQWEAITERLRTKRLLLVLDNCEHLLEASALVASRLLRECPGLRILATSREALRLTGEATWAVPGLTSPAPAHLTAQGTALLRVLAGYDSVRLFAERAPAPFTLTADNARTVAQICARLEGVPLALELAAARTRAMTADQIAARLDNHLDLLTGGDRTAPSRQQALRATLDWSYALLSVSEQLLLARVSVFAGGWTLEAAEAICSGEGVAPHRILDLLTSLVDKSLTRFEARLEGGGRYRLLEMVRQYAAERLGTEDVWKTTRTRHRDWFLALAEENAAKPTGQAPLKQEQDNLREAIEWSERDADGAQLGLKLVGALAPFWFAFSRYSEGRMFLRRALDRTDAQEATMARGKALTGAAKLADRQGDYASARALYEEALGLYRALEARPEAASALGNLGEVALRQGDTAASHAFYTEVRAIYTEDLAIYRASGDMEGVSLRLNWLATIAYHQGELAQARTYLEENLISARALGNRFHIAMAIANIGAVARDQGDYLDAKAYIEESLLLLREENDRKSIGDRLRNLGGVAQDLGDLASARQHLEEALDLFRDLDDKKDIALTLGDLARVARDQGDLLSALAMQEESVILFQALGDPVGLAEGLAGMAALLHSRSESRPVPSEIEKGVRLWSAAHSLRESMGASPSPQDQHAQDSFIAYARSFLGEASFGAAWDEGRAFTFEQAAAYALAE